VQPNLSGAGFQTLPKAEFTLQAIRDSRLSTFCLSAAPAWVWSESGERLLWANAAGCAFFRAASEDALLERTFGPADPHRRQVKQLASTLAPSGALRLERLRGFGAHLGGLMTCGCARLSLNGQTGILIAAELPFEKVLSFSDRLMALIEGIELPAVAFVDGRLAGGNTAARAHDNTLGELAALTLPTHFPAQGSNEIETPLGPATVHPAGTGAESALIVLLQGLAARSRPDKPVDAASVPVAEPEATGHVVPLQAQADTAPAAPTPPLPNEFSMDDSAGPEDPSEMPAAPSESTSDGRAGQPRRQPLRFTWAMDAEGRFSFGSDEFTKLIGAQTTAAFGRLWSEVTQALTLDPENRMAQAVATRDTFSNILLQWPADGFGARLPVEMSGLPIYGHDRAFVGYRGFGICRDLDGLTRVAAQRLQDTLFDASSAPTTTPDVAISSEEAPPTPVEPMETEDADAPVNVVPFRPANDDARPPTLTPGENNAFQELARQLSARLDNEAEQRLSAQHQEEANDSTAEQPDDDMIFEAALDEPDEAAPAQPNRTVPAPANTSLYDLLPSGVLVYRGDRLLYANPAFLAATGYTTMAALNGDGGLGALYVGPGTADANASGDGTPIRLSTVSMGTHNAHDAKLHTIDWEGEDALALILSPQATAPQADHAAPLAIAEPPPPEDRIEADELATILETTTEGVVMFDGDGRINACNRSAEALFSRDGAELEGRNLIELFAPESQRAVIDYLEGIKSDAMQGLLEQGRDVLGRAPGGGAMALSITMGRTKPDSARYFVVFRDKTHAVPRQDQTKRADERTANAKADLLARLSHEVRAPINAIIGFADVMIEERFGTLGNERYADYLKDIRASGERVIAIIDDMLDLSQIESGKLDLDFARQDLNALVEQCVGVLQPQANRERIIIRSSLTHGLPSIQADAQALRQIALTLIGCAIHLANAGGQVIVSTALNDLGEVALRIRDTGHGMNDNEIAAAMAPFRTPSPADEVAAGNGTNLSLAKALVEANRGRFHIKSAPNAGTLIEVVFSQAAATA
jgi:PAS domain S-box-containing protein